jgi:hypothetical protein
MAYTQYPDLEDPEILRKLYVDLGYSCEEIADYIGFDCSADRVMHKLRAFGIPRRAPEVSRRLMENRRRREELKWQVA